MANHQLHQNHSLLYHVPPSMDWDAFTPTPATTENAPWSDAVSRVTSSQWPSSSSSTAAAALAIPPNAAYLASGAAVTISLLGIGGNLLTMAALQRYSARLNSPATTRFVVHLALNDLLFCALVMPVTACRYFTRDWPFGETLCRLYPFFYYGTVATSLMLITVISVNRLILIVFNKHYASIYRHRNTMLMIAFCWLFSYGIMSVPLFELWGRLGLKANTFSCTILRDQAGRSPKKLLFSFGFLMPMTVILTCYGIIFAHVRRQRMAIQKTSKKDLRLTFLISVVFGTFLVCFLPLFVLNVFVPEERFPYLHILASILAWANSCINPFIYFLMNPRYRNAYKHLLRIPTGYNVKNQHFGPGLGRGNGSLLGGRESSFTSETMATCKVNGNSRLLAQSKVDFDLNGRLDMN